MLSDSKYWKSFSITKSPTDKNSPAGSSHSKIPLKLRILESFHEALSDEEANPRYDLRKSLQMDKFFLRFQKLCKVKLTATANSLIQTLRSDDLRNIKLLKVDIQNMSCRVKQLDLINTAEGKMLFLQAKNALSNSMYTEENSLESSTGQITEKGEGLPNSTKKKKKRLGQSKPVKTKKSKQNTIKLPKILRGLSSISRKYRSSEQADRLLKMANERFELAIAANPNNPEILFWWGQSLNNASRGQIPAKEAKKFLAEALDKLKRCTTLVPAMTQAYFIQACVLVQLAAHYTLERPKEHDYLLMAHQCLVQCIQQKEEQASPTSELSSLLIKHIVGLSEETHPVPLYSYIDEALLEKIKVNKKSENHNFLFFYLIVI